MRCIAYEARPISCHGWFLFSYLLACCVALWRPVRCALFVFLLLLCLFFSLFGVVVVSLSVSLLFFSSSGASCVVCKSSLTFHFLLKANGIVRAVTGQQDRLDFQRECFAIISFALLLLLLLLWGLEIELKRRFFSVFFFFVFGWNGKWSYFVNALFYIPSMKTF